MGAAWKGNGQLLISANLLYIFAITLPEIHPMCYAVKLTLCPLWFISFNLTTGLHRVRHRVAQCLLFLSATVNIEGYYYLATRRIHIGISPLCYSVKFTLCPLWLKINLQTNRSRLRFPERERNLFNFILLSLPVITACIPFDLYFQIQTVQPMLNNTVG